MNKAKKRHPLVDTKKPNLLEDTYPYSLPPLIRFEGPVVEYIDGKAVEFDFGAVKDSPLGDALRRNILITDTTFRDGQQARPPYTVDQMVHIYDLMSRLGGPNGVIRQTEFFLYTKNDRETLERCRALGHKYPECTGWIRDRLDSGTQRGFSFGQRSRAKRNRRAHKLLRLPHIS